MSTLIRELGNATISSVKSLFKNKYFGNIRERLIQYGLFYSVGAMNILFKEESMFTNITKDEITHFKTAHPIEKYDILYRLLYNVIPNDKKIKIPAKQTSTSTSNTTNLENYTIPTEYNLLGYIEKNADKPLDYISRLLLPFKFSNLSWYINNQLVNNRDYLSLLEIITLFDAFIEVEGHERFFYNYIQKVKLTGITTTDIEFILSIIWLIMDTDLNDTYSDKYTFDKTKFIDLQFELVELKNVFNIIFHIDNSNLTGFKTGLEALSKLGVTAVFLKDIKLSLIDGLSEPYKTKCRDNIYTLTFAQYIAALLLSIKDNTPLAMIELGVFQRLFDEVLHKKPNITNLNELIQHGGSVIITATVSSFIKPLLTFVYEKSTFILSNIDTYSKTYLDFLYTKNITYNALKTLVIDNKYIDSFIYIIEEPTHSYPYLRALLLTMEFKKILSPADRKIFIKSNTTTNKDQSSKNKPNNLFYRPPETDLTPLKNAFKTVKFNVKTETLKKFDSSFILTILAIFGGSWGDLIKSYEIINNTLSSNNDIDTYQYILIQKKKQNIFDSPARLIINAINSIKNNKKLIVYLRQLILYQIIFTNTYLLIVDKIAERDVITGKIKPSETNYKDAASLAIKIADLLYTKNNESVNLIINAFVNPTLKHTVFNTNEIQIICKCIDFNHLQNIILEMDKYILAEKLGLLKQLSGLEPKESDSVDSKSSNTAHNSNNSFVSAVTNQSSSGSSNNFYNTIDNEQKIEKIEKNTLLRGKLLNFFKRIFQYNLAMTSFDIENLLEFNIDNTIMICDETRDILDFYSVKPDAYELFIPIDLTKKINFIEY